MGYRKLIERVDATYDKWFRHFQDVEAHLAPETEEVEVIVARFREEANSGDSTARL